MDQVGLLGLISENLISRALRFWPKVHLPLTGPCPWALAIVEGKTGSRALLNAGYLQQLKPNSLYPRPCLFKDGQPVGCADSKTALIGWV